ncbi:MAG TPA: ATP-dependent RecD-like DNA helicase, partial [Clostridia bacterium]
MEEIIYKNEANGFTVCEINSSGELMTAVGCMPFINEGETICVSGKMVNHPDYGEQIKVEYYEKRLPKTSDAILKYLGSGAVKGVRIATARKIVEKFGEESLDIIENNFERLSEIKGINPEKARKIGESFKSQRELMQVVLFFHDFDISPTYSAKVYKVFGSSTIQTIRENPYTLVSEEFGIGFRTADRIASALGIDPCSKHRVACGIRYVLGQATFNGHTYIPEEMLKSHASNLLDINLDSIDDAMASLLLNGSVHIERGGCTNKVYLSSYYKAEVSVCRALAEFSRPIFNTDIGDFEEKISIIEAEEGIVLAARQKEAVKQALLNGVLVITGGPGTGKTTIIKSIIMLLTNEGYDVALAAPTGRAAKRMTEATGFEAKTIHRLLEAGYTGEDTALSFTRNEENPIEADVIIIDEMSMVDILLMESLLKSVSHGTRLVLVGDTDQLPSVGAGNVLSDIMESGVIQTVKLKEIFRQAEESMIIVNAHRINDGEYPYLNVKGKDFFFIPKMSAEEIAKTVMELCSRRLPVKYGYEPLKHIQVLSPMKKGLAGVINLNMELQRVLNPKEKGKNERSSQGFTFREGDRVMQTRNNYQLKWRRPGIVDEKGEGVFNGDMGIIREIDDEEQVVRVLFDDDKLVDYGFDILDVLDPAFAITIHKSQGSEFPAVVIPVFQGPSVLM